MIISLGHCWNGNKPVVKTSSIRNLAERRMSCGNLQKQPVSHLTNLSIRGNILLYLSSSWVSRHIMGICQDISVKNEKRPKKLGHIINFMFILQWKKLCVRRERKGMYWQLAPRPRTVPLQGFSKFYSSWPSATIITRVFPT